jgi:hypothetical protein
VNPTEQFRLQSFYTLRSHKKWEKGPLCLTTATYAGKIVYTGVITIGRLDLQFSIHWHAS